jgi:hypothetical protein
LKKYKFLVNSSIIKKSGQEFLDEALRIFGVLVHTSPQLGVFDRKSDFGVILNERKFYDKLWNFSQVQTHRFEKDLKSLAIGSGCC